MANPARAHFAAELRAARGRRRLTQADLAAHSGIAVNTIFRFENEQREPRIGQIVVLAEALGVPARSFLPESDPRIAELPDDHRAAS